MITTKQYEQIKADAKLMNGNIGSACFKLIEIVDRIKETLEDRIDSTEIYYEEEYRMRSEARKEMAYELLESMFKK